MSRVHHSARPMDSYVGLQPMTADDLAFAQRNAVDERIRFDWRLFALLAGLCVIVPFVACIFN